MIRRLLMVAALLGASLASLAMTATTASAQYQNGQPGIIVNPGSTTVGGKVVVEGSGCPAGSTVTIKIGDVVVGTVTANGDGDFSDTIVLPPSIVPGTYTVHALCGNLDLTTVLSVSALAATTTAGTTGTLPRTGTDSGLWVKVGRSLVVVGGLLVLATRRRRVVH